MTIALSVLVFILFLICGRLINRQGILLDNVVKNKRMINKLVHNSNVVGRKMLREEAEKNVKPKAKSRKKK